MVLQNNWKRIAGRVLINISPSNIFSKMLFPERFHLNCQASSAIISARRMINGQKLIIHVYQNQLLLLSVGFIVNKAPFKWKLSLCVQRTQAKMINLLFQ